MEYIDIWTKTLDIRPYKGQTNDVIYQDMDKPLDIDHIDGIYRYMDNNFGYKII